MVNRLSLPVALVAFLLYGMAFAVGPDFGGILFLAGILASLVAAVAGTLSRTRKAGRLGRNLGLAQLVLVALFFVWITPRF